MSDEPRSQQPVTEESTRPVWIKLATGLLMGLLALVGLGVLFLSLGS